MNAFDLIRHPVVLFDVETTGLNPQRDRVIEIAAIRVTGNGRQEFATVVRPDPVPRLDPQITKITGITQRDVEAGMDSAAAFLKLANWLDDGPVIVGHNVPFDIGFLDAELERHDLPPWIGDFVCTRALATFLGKGIPALNRAGNPYTSYQLQHVCQALGVELDGAHRALNDLAATEQCLLRLWPRAIMEHKPIMNAMVRPEWVQDQIDAGRRAAERTPDRAVVYLVA